MKYRLTAIMSLALCALWGWEPVEASSPPEREATTWVAIPDGEWILGSDIIYLRDLQDSLQLVPELQGVTVSPWPGHDYRISDALSGGDALFQAAYLAPTSLDSLTEPGVTLIHEIGLNTLEMEQETNLAADDIESILGERPITLAYPRHMHTRELMIKLRDDGWLCARDGAPHGTGGGEPTAAFLLGYHSNPEWRMSWEYWSPWELPLSTGLDEEAVQSAFSRADMHDLLYDTQAYNAAHPNVNVYTYAYDNVVDMWLDNNTWSHLYAHGSPTHDYPLDGLHLGWFIDELIADGRFWIDDIRTIGAYAHERHQPSLLDSLVYEPNGAYGTEPWNGHPCAFTFSTDDGRIINLEYADTLLARGVNMTAFIIRDALNWTQGTHLTEAQLIELHAKGNVEVGSHSKSHPRLIPEESLVLRNSGPTPVACEIVDEGGERLIRFYRVGAVGVEQWNGAGGETILHPCFPNPSNPQSEISYTIHAGGMVKLSIFDIRGRLVKVLVSGKQDSGEHSMIWRGTDERGEQVPSGIYFARLVANGTATSVKIALLH